MSWFAVGAAAVTVVSKGMEGEANAGRISRDSVADNDAIVKANVANTIRTGYRVGLANMQRGLQKRQNVQQGFDITRAGGNALGQASANAAAAGSVGSSVDAVLNDVHMKIGEAQAHLATKAEIDAVNYNTQIEGIAAEGATLIKGSHKVEIPSSEDIWGGAVMAGVSQFASSYATDKMKLGLGDTPAPTTGGGGSGLSMGGGSTGLKLGSSTGITGSLANKPYGWN